MCNFSSSKHTKDKKQHLWAPMYSIIIGLTASIAKCAAYYRGRATGRDDDGERAAAEASAQSSRGAQAPISLVSPQLCNDDAAAT